MSTHTPDIHKHKVEDLAIFQKENVRQPVYPKFIPVGRPNLGDKQSFLDKVNQMWDTRYLTNGGPFVAEFEKKMEEYLGVKHFISICNGTIALEIAIRALGLKGEVIVPSFTFIATAHSLKWQEITPVFCDIDPVTHTIDPKKVRELITPNTTGIIGVHVWGQPCDVDALDAIAKEKNLKVMYDSAHAMGCSYKGKMVGNFGDCEVLSFHATKFFNTFEGGAITTNDDELAKKIRLMKNFGFAGYDNVIYIGTNGKMTEVCAALGLVNMQCINHFIDINKQNYLLYKSVITPIKGIKFHDYDVKHATVNYQYLVMEVDEKEFGLSRDRLVEVITAENLSARKYFYPGCHKMQPYRDYFPHAHFLLEHTIKLCSRVICLPTGTAVTSEDILKFGQLLKFVSQHVHDISKKFDDRDKEATSTTKSH